MGDAELEEIRAKRLAQLRSQFGPDSGGDPRQQEEREKQANEIRNNILSQILNQSCRARLNTLMIAKPNKGKMVENMLLQMAQSGRLPRPLLESEFIKIMESMNEQTKTTIKFDRRRAALDDSDDETLQVSRDHSRSHHSVDDSDDDLT